MTEKEKKADRTLRVDLGERAYDIHIGRDMLADIAAYVPLDLSGRTLFVLTDENVSMPHAATVYNALKGVGAESVQLLAVPAGEESKSFEMLQRVLAWMLDHGVNRHSILFTVGGGVIGDLGGFAAATVMRGINFVQVPTSLLAQVDSSVGGKTGIDVPQGKNLVGAFYQPIAVLCDIATLDTLPRRELLAGYAEVVKYGLIDDLEFFVWLERDAKKLIEGDYDARLKAVEISCRKKAEIVAADEKESGRRALLNLGHTFGHALETAAGYDGRLLHGEGVAIGTVLAFHLSCRMGVCAFEDVRRVEEHFSALGLPGKISMIFPPLDVSVDELYESMKRDKKATAQGIAFILVQGIGKAYISADVKEADVKDLLKISLQGR